MAFEGILGHKIQKDLILSFLKQRRIPHAFLFTGQEGIGKKTLALEVAKILFCQRKEGCGICSECKKVENRVHPDLIVIGEEGEPIGVEISRFLREEIHTSPFEGEKRIILIDNAEAMTMEASNALLKTLEEPPTFNLFILVASSEKRIPITIESRCVKIGFNPLMRKDIEEFLTKTYGLEEKKAKIISSMSFGSIGLSLFWLEENNLFLRRKISECLIGKGRNPMDITLLSENLSSEKRKLTIFLFFLLSLVRDLYILNKLNDTSFVINSDLIDLLTHRRYEPSSLIEAIKMIQEAQRNLLYNVNRWLLIEHLLFGLRRKL